MSGSGSNLHVVVTIDEQASELSTQVLSYALSEVMSLDPDHGITDGGYTMTVEGKHFGLRDATSSAVVTMDGVHLVTVDTRSEGAGARKRDVIVVNVPSGYGVSNKIQVKVTSGLTGEVRISNNAMIFRYDDPTISQVYTVEPNTQQIALYGWNSLLMYIVGTNFCGSTSCASVLGKVGQDTEYRSKQITSITHREIVVVIYDKRGEVFVLVGGERNTTTVSFETLNPEIDSVLQSGTLDGTKFQTLGNVEEITVYGSESEYSSWVGSEWVAFLFSHLVLYSPTPTQNKRTLWPNPHSPNRRQPCVLDRPPDQPTVPKPQP